MKDYMNNKTKIQKEILTLIEYNNGYIELKKLYNKLLNKYSKDMIDDILNSLELIDCITLTVDSRGRDIIEITKTGKEYLRILKGSTIWDRIINAIIYNPMIRKILGLDI